MSSRSDEKTRLLRALSDRTRLIIVEVLAKGDFEEGFTLDGMRSKLEHDGDLVCKRENLYKHLEVLRGAELLRHGLEKRAKWQHARWFPVPREVYSSILRNLEYIQDLTEIGSSITSLVTLFPQFIIHKDDKQKREELRVQFIKKARLLFEPSNFGLISPSIVWKVFKMSTHPAVDLDLSDLV